MKVDQLNIGCDAANGHIAVGAERTFATASDDSGNVSAVAILVVGPASQRIVVVHDAIMPLRVLQIIHTMDATVDDSDCYACSIKPEIPSIVCQHADGGIVHLIGDRAV